MTMGRRYDFTGKRFGKLTVISYSHSPEMSGGKKSVWNVICDCGNKKAVLGYNLKNKSTVSCGCHRENRLNKNPREACVNRSFYEYKKSARQRNYNFDLEFDYFKEIVKQNCFYCGGLPRIRKRIEKVNGDIPMNGIDRIDSKIGYTRGSVAPCCEICNRMKSSLALDDFLSHIKHIYEHSNLNSHNKDNINISHHIGRR